MVDLDSKDLLRAKAILKAAYGPSASDRARELSERLPASSFAKAVERLIEIDADMVTARPLTTGRAITSRG